MSADVPPLPDSERLKHRPMTDAFAPTPDAAPEAEPPRVLIPRVVTAPAPPPDGPMYDLADPAFGAGWRAQVIVPPGVAPPLRLPLDRRAVPGNAGAGARRAARTGGD